MTDTPRYPKGTVRALLDSPHVTERTRDVLRARLSPPSDAPRVLDAELFATLRAVCARLVPQDDVEIAADVERQLAEGPGNGWRYATMPPDRELLVAGLRGIDAIARADGAAATTFVALDGAQQDALLARVQHGDPRVPARFFEELLAAAVAAYYGHPLAQEEIGYAGMADAPAGWERIALGDREPREPEPL